MFTILNDTSPRLALAENPRAMTPLLRAAGRRAAAGGTPAGRELTRNSMATTPHS